MPFKTPYRGIWGIKRSTLKMMLEAAKSSHPREFAALLRAKDGIITELVLLPGTVSGKRHASLPLHMLPIDFTVVGSVHSHPAPHTHPSSDDLFFFGKFGRIHILISYPYDEGSWQAYDLSGSPLELKIVD